MTQYQKQNAWGQDPNRRGQWYCCGELVSQLPRLELPQRVSILQNDKGKESDATNNVQAAGHHWQTNNMRSRHLAAGQGKPQSRKQSTIVLGTVFGRCLLHGLTLHVFSASKGSVKLQVGALCLLRTESTYPCPDRP